MHLLNEAASLVCELFLILNWQTHLFASEVSAVAQTKRQRRRTVVGLICISRWWHINPPLLDGGGAVRLQCILGQCCPNRLHETFHAEQVETVLFHLRQHDNSPTSKHLATAGNKKTAIINMPPLWQMKGKKGLKHAKHLLKQMHLSYFKHLRTYWSILFPILFSHHQHEKSH